MLSSTKWVFGVPLCALEEAYTIVFQSTHEYLFTKVSLFRTGDFLEKKITDE